MEILPVEQGAGLPFVKTTVLLSVAFGFVSLIVSFSFFAGLGGFGKNKFVVDERTVLITGASQGMGLGVAKLLSSKGANIVIVARDVTKLQAALKEIAAAAKRPQVQRFHYISADVTSSDENIRVLEEVTKWNNGNPPDIVWAIAGTSTPHLFLDTPIELFRKQMDINYFAALYLAHATLRSWLTGDVKTSTPNKYKDKNEAPLPRHFIMTGSLLSFCGISGYSPYSPAKSAIRSLHDTLRMELNLYNHTDPDTTRTKSEQRPEVKIHTVFPGSILSPGYEQEELTKHASTKILEKDDPRQTPDQIAEIVVSELERGRHMIVTHWLGMIMRAAGLMVSVRDNWLIDTVLSWIISPIILIIQPDLEGKVRKWAKENGTPAALKPK